MSKGKLRRRAYDEAWKKVLENYFWHFLDFYFPQMAARIDRGKGYTFLEQELLKIDPRARSRKRRVDKLVKVFVKGQGEVWLLIHVEVQTSPEADFASRMYNYHYRIYDRHQRPVASLAVLADNSASFRPTSFELTALGKTFVHFEYEIVKLLDWKGKEEQLQEDPNPFAVVTLASLKCYEQRYEKRYHWKYLLTTMLYDRGYSEEMILGLYHFIDAIMVLPEGLEIQYNEDVAKFEGEKTMPYITTAERIGIQKGEIQTLQQDILEVLTTRFEEPADDIAAIVQKLRDKQRLRELHRQAIVTPDLQSFAKYLRRSE